MRQVANIEDYKLKIKHDGTIMIATGMSRKDIRWKNQELTYSQLINKLRKTTYTSETYEEYKKLPKIEQDRIKDVGGFVGGTLKEGRRKSDAVLTRSILTLDADFATTDFWENINLLFGFGCCVYSTHKHSTDKPRFRLIVPLSRAVSPEEYEAIARMVAKDIGIDYFDDTTYQPSRLMYWPSTSSGGDYFFDYIDGPWIDVDEILGRYPDWKDTSFWPESSRATNVRRKMADKQGEPTEKKGLIGAFCRAYTIDDAIESFLSDIYTPCAMEGRYTYVGGSTSAGLVVYEGGKFAYSNHATDPAGSKLCNAFDLVRIHKFHELDEGMPLDTSIEKLPSFKAMKEFASKDKAVRVESISNAKSDFEEGFDPDSDVDWIGTLDVNPDTGKPVKTIRNIEIILRNDPRLKRKMGVDLFNGRIAVQGDLPWRRKENSVLWKDSDDSGLRSWLEKEYGITGAAKIEDAFINVCEENSFHPVREYLEALEWDGVERLDTLFIDYLGAKDNVYVRAVTRKQFVAAVARIFKPGIKKDEMLILVGVQGMGKSTILRKIGREEWFSDSIDDFKGKDTYEGLLGSWIIEIGELGAMKKSEVETVKNFLTKQTDRFRMSYGKRTLPHPRQCVFFGTTNSEEFLKDKTGNRRFWPVSTDKNKATKKIATDLDDYEVNQIWAEAKYYLEQGEKVYIDNDEVERLAIEAQLERTEQDPRVGQIEEYLNLKLPLTWSEMSIQDRRGFIHDNAFGEPEEYFVRDRVCALEVWCELFRGDVNSRSGYDVKEINSILSHIQGWRRAEKSIRFGKLYGVQKGFVRVEET